MVSGSGWGYLRIQADGSSLLPEFDSPSRLKALRSLQVGAWATDFKPVDTRHPAVMEVFSTITSPAFSDLVIVFGGDGMSYLPLKVTLSETLRAMNQVRPFKLVFLFEVKDPFHGEARRKSEGVRLGGCIRRARCCR